MKYVTTAILARGNPSAQDDDSRLAGWSPERGGKGRNSFKRPVAPLTFLYT